MKIRKLFRSILFYIKKIYLLYYKSKINLLYGDCIHFGKNVNFNKISFDIHPQINGIYLGNEIHIRENAVIRVGKNAKVEIGNGFFANKGLSINSLSEIIIGDNTIFGEDVKIYDHNHGYRDNEILIKEQAYSIGSIKIGNNCWIGSNVVILKGVNIGDNCIIGANCILYKSIPSNSLVKSEQRLNIELKSRP